jgi:hypothetical protein
MLAKNMTAEKPASMPSTRWYSSKNVATVSIIGFSITGPVILKSGVLSKSGVRTRLFQISGFIAV